MQNLKFSNTFLVFLISLSDPIFLRSGDRIIVTKTLVKHHPTYDGITWYVHVDSPQSPAFRKLHDVNDQILSTVRKLFNITNFCEPRQLPPPFLLLADSLEITTLLISPSHVRFPSPPAS